MLDINKIKKENLINTSTTTNELLEYLKKNYPQTISDNAPNLNAIAQLLGLNTKNQGYELNFTGKPLANALYNTPNTKEIKFHQDYSKDTQNTKNIIIKGDNLHALKLLKQSYYEKIKMIYIDPPYNTKNDKFIYNDDFVKEHRKLLLQTGLLEIDDEGNEIRSETLNFFINQKGDRIHSAWLSFMLPRLKLARDLLREDGVIFISIDDNEQANLKILCDEIFGEENVETYIWNLSDFEETSFTKTASKTVRFEHEYIIACFKNIKSLGRFKEYRFSDREDFTNPDNDPRGDWMSGNISRNGITSTNGSKYYTITSPKGIEYTRNWTVSKEEFDKLIKDNRIFFPKNGEGVPRLKIFQNEESYSIQSSILSGLKTSVTGKKQIVTLFNKDVFSFPKPTFLIQRFLEIATCKTEDDYILDFFAGSGTTAQAVMELNAQDNGNRKFILVQLDESIDEKKSKVAYDFCKNELNSKNPVISDITIERVKRAGEKIAKENADKNLDLGFKVFSMVEKPELVCDDNESLNLINHAKLSPYEKALNLALQDCKCLDDDIKVIFKDRLYQCEQSFYVINFDDEVLNFLKNTHDENVYINGFDDIDLEIYLNLESFLKERLKVVY
ncbi:site-specific DNA-methyltransferase [Campylobacter sp. W0066.1]|uniref:site-specific DNA-methyltransferase n=1 Tax=Campylobacter sp. W0066.1 TaxID=2735751 RepID=UPI00298768AC|nr:site-specific DNA-methyltransferase [Campylobacter sp. W0066.1]HEG2606902.1 site-specific DNA-methyltransferase [Campylobacter lari]HEG2607515.1 site-specific DNA-methyltransferase [Campylobacter lari]